MGHVRHAPDRVEIALRHRVDVDPPLVGTLDVGAPGVPGVKLDRRHLHRPDHAAELGHAQLVGVAPVAGERDPHGLDPVGRPRRDSLLMDLVAVDAARKAVEHARPLAQRADDPVTDAHVVPGQVELGLAARREVHAVGAAYPDRSAGDLEFNGRGLGRHHLQLDIAAARISSRNRPRAARVPTYRGRQPRGSRSESPAHSSERDRLGARAA